MPTLYLAHCTRTLEIIQASLAASHQVQLEDVDISESVQRGLLSDMYIPGRYPPRVEHADFAFHSHLKRELKAELAHVQDY
jgi:choline monooxygenase